MTTIQRPNSRIIAMVLVAVVTVTGTFNILKRAGAPEQVQAGAITIYKSEAKWYNGPVAKPVLSNDFMAFNTLWENAGQSRYLYVTDLAAGKDAKITIDAPISSNTRAAVSNNYVAWNNEAKNKSQIKLFERYSYQTFIVTDTMNEVSNPAIDGTRVVWNEANGDQNGGQIKFYDHSAPAIRTIAAGKHFHSPAIAGNHVVWFESSAECKGAAYRFCAVGGPWDLVAYDLNTQTTTVIAKNQTIKAGDYPLLAASATQVVWSAKTKQADGSGQYDLWRHVFTSGSIEQLTNNALIETALSLSNGRVAYIGMSVSGKSQIAHVFDIATRQDMAMPYKKANHSNVTISQNRVAWDEVRADSRIYIYDFTLQASKQDSDEDALPAETEQKLGTDDLMKDTDGDGLNDTDESVLFMTNPTAMDSDGDGITDYRELYLYKTNPMMFDTDGDGYHDGLEVKNGYSPLNPKPVKVGKNIYEWSASPRP